MVPHICEPLTTQPIDKCLELHPHISELDLADNPMDETHEIDMSIGSDFIGSLLLAKWLEEKVLWLSILHWAGCYLDQPTSQEAEDRL